MVYRASLYVALAIFALGLAYKVSAWFRYRIGADVQEIPPSARVGAAVKGIIRTLFSRKILTLLKALFLDAILQVKVFREDLLRWLMHACIFFGFMLLLLFHALEKYVSAPLFSGYYPTVNPFMFLRDLFGAMVIIGVGIAIYRRFVLKTRRLKTNAQDQYAIAILAVIMISGILLHGSKIISHTRYQEMVQEYTILTDEQELKALEAYWVDKYGVVSPNIKGPFDAEILQQGKLLNEMSCLECHSRPQSALLSYGSALLMRPAALALDKAHLPTLLWYLHFLSCFVGLAYLPFSRMFHIFASPVSLMVNAVMEKGKSAPANVATRQVMELDACTHCGTCSTRCSVGVVSEEIPNVNILPSEKIASIKALASGKELSARELRALQEGVYLCTSCYRCTVACPSGINLQDLWFSVRETLLAKGHPEFLTLSPFSLSRGLMKDLIEPTRYRQPVERALESMVPKESLVQLEERAPVAFPSGDGLSNRLRASLQAVNFADCFRCRTCSNACPVVGIYERPATMLGLLPHQIMHSVALRLWDLIFSSKMLWYCLGCYQCQEHCPQSVHVTEILYELKNMAIAQAMRSLSQEKKGE